MGIINSVITAFSMFSRVPMPRVKWSANNMRYTMAAFPLVGLLLGLAVYFFNQLAIWLAFTPLLSGVGITLVPILITGGIHLDGFCDTTDALSSHASPEKKQEILKDPHVGAFAAIYLAVYLLAFTALAVQFMAESPNMLCFAAVFVLSRALSGLSVVLFPSAKTSGMSHTFADAASKKVSAVALCLQALIAAVFMVFQGGWAGAVALVAMLICWLYYRHTALKQFKGISGDLAGWFVQLAELAGLAALALMPLILRVLS